MAGKRILYLLPFAPRLDATHGGGRVIGQLLAEMASRHTLAILYLRSAAEPPADEFFRAHCAQVEEVIRETPGRSLAHRAGRLWQIARSLAQRKPVWVSDWANRDYGRRLQAIVQSFQPDLIEVCFQVMGQYLPAIRAYNAPRVLSVPEAGVRAAPYIKDGPVFLQRAIAAWEKNSWRRYERQIIQQVQAVIALTPEDAQALQPFAGKVPVICIPPGAAIPDQPLDALGTAPPSLLFIGSFNHPANVHAAQRLVRSIFPAVCQRLPETRLTIVGEAPPASLLQAAGPNLQVTGRVPSVAPYLDQAAVFVAPLSTGGGIRIKVLEALAAGKAVVATPLAAQGLGLVDGRQIALAESDAELVERIVDLLSDPTQRAAMGQQAREWACQNLRWETAVNAYEAVYASLLDVRASSNGQDR